MARCPFCDHILEDDWLKKMGAALMGKASGAAKARSTEMTSSAAKKRWNLHDELLNTQAENQLLREQLEKAQKKKKKFPT
jgi:hypothetical protein